MDPAKLDAATAFAAKDAETLWPMDLKDGLNSARDQNEPLPWGEVLGPTKPRGKPNGVILRGGRIVAEWGDTGRVDMKFSIAKIYLSILAGLAVAKGLIRSVAEPIREDRKSTRMNSR